MGEAMGFRQLVLHRAFTWALAVALGSVSAVTCLIGAQTTAETHHCCVGMEGCDKPTVTADCCAAGEILGIASGAAFELIAPVATVTILAPLSLLAALTESGTAIQADTGTSSARPTYLVIASFRI